jgi:hypothetical protein
VNPAEIPAGAPGDQLVLGEQLALIRSRLPLGERTPGAEDYSMACNALLFVCEHWEHFMAWENAATARAHAQGLVSAAVVARQQDPAYQSGVLTCYQTAMAKMDDAARGAFIAQGGAG